jgi:hypothetical protein
MWSMSRHVCSKPCNRRGVYDMLRCLLPTRVLYPLETGTSGTTGTFAMPQTDNANKIRERSLDVLYRFPSWYQPKPVQGKPQTGTAPVWPPAIEMGESAEGGMLPPGTVPVVCTGNDAPCTGNDATLTRAHATQPFENAAHALECGPKVPEVPVSQTYKSPVAQQTCGSPFDAIAQAEHALRTTLPMMAPDACYACGTTRRWRSVYSAVVCGTCHSPADQALVAGWEGEDRGEAMSRAPSVH